MQTLSLLALIFIAATAAPSQHFVSPPGRHALEGSSYTHYPLGRANARVQTLHDNVPGGVVFGAHAYRRDAIGVRGLVPGLSSELRVTLSMAPHPAASASASFAANVGPNPVVVLPRQLIAIPATDRPGLDPAAQFELVIPYARPFSVPLAGGTLCVDVEVFGNLTSIGRDQDVSLYLDSHQLFADGRAKQRGFRTLAGCPAPGSQSDCHANLDCWRMPSGSTEFDISIRNGVADRGGGTARAFLTMGNDLSPTPWPLRTDCTFLSSSELWFSLPGPMTVNGTYDGTLSGLPPLPPGLRLWCQAGSIDLQTIGMSFSEALTLVTPPLGSLPRPSMRIASGDDVTSTTGAVSASVPVMAFY